MTIYQDTADAYLGVGATGTAGDVGTGFGAGAAGIDEDLTGMVECVSITQVTHNVKSFELFAPWMSRIDFEPGQYVTVRIPELGLERCYSIASVPFGSNTFTLTVKRVDGGAVSTHLHDVLGVGDRIHVDGPYGLFSTSFHPAAKHCSSAAVRASPRSCRWSGPCWPVLREPRPISCSSTTRRPPTTSSSGPNSSSWRRFPA
ncbi:MAG: FAD-binding oxidoreductase [Brevibacterium sp.]|nr:FAD-binding oxidoreductase [Brevibacterium sp.]